MRNFNMVIYLIFFFFFILKDCQLLQRELWDTLRKMENFKTKCELLRIIKFLKCSFIAAERIVFISQVQSANTSIAMTFAIQSTASVCSKLYRRLCDKLCRLDPLWFKIKNIPFLVILARSFFGFFS